MPLLSFFYKTVLQMALKMASTFKRAGVWYYRKAVPFKVRHLIGKTEEVISLGTSDASEASILFSRVAAEGQERWDALIGDRPRPAEEARSRIGGAYSIDG